MVVEEPQARALDPDVAPWLGYGIAALGTIAPLMVWRARLGAIADALALLAFVSPILSLACVLYAPEKFEANYRWLGKMVNLVLIAPVATMFVLVAHVPLVSWHGPELLATAGAMLALLAGAMMPVRPALASPLVLLAFLVIYGAMFGWAAPQLIDVKMDQAPGQAFRAPIMLHGSTWGRYGRSYYVVLGPWGPIEGQRMIRLSAADSQALDGRSTACVTLHDGALRIPWYSLAPC